LVWLGLAGLSGKLVASMASRRTMSVHEAERNGQRELWGISAASASDEWAVETPQVRASKLAGFHW